MSTRRFNREAGAWSLAIAMGLLTFLAQPRAENRSPQATDKITLSSESAGTIKHTGSGLSEETQRTGIVLDNSIEQ